MQADEREVVTPLSVLTGYLNSRHPGAAVLTVAEPLVDQTLLAAGIAVTAEPSDGRRGRRVLRPDLRLHQAAAGRSVPCTGTAR